MLTKSLLINITPAPDPLPFVDDRGQLLDSARELAAHFGDDIPLLFAPDYAVIDDVCPLCVERLHAHHIGFGPHEDLEGFAHAVDKLHPRGAVILRDNLHFCCDEPTCVAGANNTGSQVVRGKQYAFGLTPDLWWTRLKNYVPPGSNRRVPRNLSDSERQDLRDQFRGRGIALIRQTCEAWGAAGPEFIRWLVHNPTLACQLAAKVPYSAPAIPNKLCSELLLTFGLEGAPANAVDRALTGLDNPPLHLADPTQDKGDEHDSSWLWYQVRPGFAGLITDTIKSLPPTPGSNTPPSNPIGSLGNLVT